MTETTDVKLSAGAVLKGRYTIVRLIGSGGMGAIYEARDRVLDRRVALKILHASVAGDTQVHARFLQEARAASALDHPHVVKSLDFGMHAGSPFMVMEYLEGESFGDLLAREGPLSPVRAWSLLDPVARAIDRAHRAGVIHRDIKPHNVFLADGDGDDVCVPKLVDFGIAKRSQDADLLLTKTSVALGTPFYMPPEQVMDAKDVSAAADQYAFAVMLYESVARSFPHDGHSYNELIINKVTRDPRPIRAARPDVSEAFQDVLLRALSRDPSARYPSMAAFRQALLEAIGAPIPAPTNPKRIRGEGGPPRARDEAVLREASSLLAGFEEVSQRDEGPDFAPPWGSGDASRAVEGAARPTTLVADEGVSSDGGLRRPEGLEPATPVGAREDAGEISRAFTAVVAVDGAGSAQDAGAPGPDTRGFGDGETGAVSGRVGSPAAAVASEVTPRRGVLRADGERPVVSGERGLRWTLLGAVGGALVAALLMATKLRGGSSEPPLPAGQPAPSRAEAGTEPDRAASSPVIDCAPGPGGGVLDGGPAAPQGDPRGGPAAVNPRPTPQSGGIPVPPLRRRSAVANATAPDRRSDAGSSGASGVPVLETNPYLQN